MWNETIYWVRNIYDPHFTMSDHEEIVGFSSNNQVTHLKTISVKDVIYQKRKEGKEMVISDVKKCLLKNLNIIKSKDVVLVLYSRIGGILSLQTLEQTNTLVGIYSEITQNCVILITDHTKHIKCKNG